MSNDPTATDALAVTGIGCISGIGIGTPAFERGLFAGERAYRVVSAFDTSHARAHSAGHLDGFDPSTFIAPAKLRRIDRVGQLAVAAVDLRSSTRSSAGRRRSRRSDRRGSRQCHGRHAIAW